MNSTKRNTTVNRVPAGTFLGLSALLLLVAGLGFVVFQQIDQIVQSAKQASDPSNDRLLAVQGIVSNLYDAENSAMRYSMSREESYKAQWESTTEMLKPKLEKLRELPFSDTLAESLSEELYDLASEKLDLLEAQINLDVANRTDEILDRLSRSLIQPERKTQTVVQEESPGPSAQAKEISEAEKKAKAAHFYRWMMGMESQQSKTDPDQDSSQPAAQPKPNQQAEKVRKVITTPVVLPSHIEKQLLVVKQQEAANYRNSLQRGMALTLQSQEVSGELREVLLKIEQHERELMVQKSAKVSNLALSANRWLLVFSIALSVFFLLIAIGIVAYIRTTRKHQASTQAAAAAAAELAETRSRFLATMSHEIRTPMNAIIGFSNQLLQQPLEEQQQSQLNHMQRAAHHLLGVVNHVLDYAKLDAGQMHFEELPFELKAELDFVTGLLREDYEQKGVALILDWPLENQLHLQGDALRLRQVLLNLLGNALKFTSKGEVRLKVQAQKRLLNSLKLRFEVKDTGIGISKARMAKVFEAFEQHDASISRKYGGTGLGLPITKLLVEQQGGEIGMESELGKGTTVWLEMTFGFGTAPKPSRQISNLPAGLNILVVDDEPYNRMLLKAMLEKWDLKCLEASNAFEAFDQIAQNELDLVLMDLRMPEMSGLEACKRIRQQKSMEELPIVLVTAAAQEIDQGEWEAAGCNLVIGKPLEEAELLAAIQAMILQNADSKERPVKVEFSLKALEQMSQGNPAFVKEMVLAYVETATKSEATILEAQKQEDLKAIQEASHRLAAPTKHLFANQLYQQIKALEGAKNLQIAGGLIKDILPQLHGLKKALLEQIVNQEKQP